MKDAAFVTVEATHIDRKEWEARSSFVNCQGVKPRNVDLSHSRFVLFRKEFPSDSGSPFNPLGVTPLKVGHVFRDF